MVIISIMIIMMHNDDHHNPSTQVMEMNFREALDTTHTVSCSDEQVLYVTISVTIGISATLTIIINATSVMIIVITISVTIRISATLTIIIFTIATFQAWAYGASLYNYLNSVGLRRFRISSYPYPQQVSKVNSLWSIE